MRLGYDLGRGARALEVARVDGVERSVGELLCELTSLAPAGVRERRVGVALPASFSVPLALAVPDEKDRRHEAKVAAAWISACATRSASSPAPPAGSVSPSRGNSVTKARSSSHRAEARTGSELCTCAPTCHGRVNPSVLLRRHARASGAWTASSTMWDGLRSIGSRS